MQIFITGTMRTGGTILINALTLHKKIAIFNERLNYFRFIYNKFKKINNSNLPIILEELRIRLKYRQQILIDKKSIINNLKNKELNHANLFDAIQNYFLKKYDNKKKIWGEYSNLSWNYIPNFLKFFKNGKVIIIIRDPRAILSSFKKITFLENHLYLNTIFNWLDLMFFLKKKIKNKCFITSFENLHNNPEKELKKICNFLKVKYSKNMSSNIEHKKLNPKKIKINISSFTKKFVYGFDKKRINNWKTNLEKWEIFLCDNLCSKYYKYFKYKKYKFSNNEIKNFEKIINKIFKKNKYLNKLLKKYIKTGKGTDTYPIDPVNAKNWSDPKNPYRKFINSIYYEKYLKEISNLYEKKFN